MNLPTTHHGKKQGYFEPYQFRALFGQLLRDLLVEWPSSTTYNNCRMGQNGSSIICFLNWGGLKLRFEIWSFEIEIGVFGCNLVTFPRKTLYVFCVLNRNNFLQTQEKNEDNHEFINALLSQRSPNFPPPCVKSDMFQRCRYWPTAQANTLRYATFSVIERI